MSDLYWSNVCIMSLKHNHDKTFEYAVYQIEDVDRKSKILDIREKWLNGDEHVRQVVNGFSVELPVVIA